MTLQAVLGSFFVAKNWRGFFFFTCCLDPHVAYKSPVFPFALCHMTIVCLKKIILHTCLEDAVKDGEKNLRDRGE